LALFVCVIMGCKRVYLRYNGFRIQCGFVIGFSTLRLGVVVYVKKVLVHYNKLFGLLPVFFGKGFCGVIVYVQRKQFSKSVPRIGHSGVRDVNSTYLASAFWKESRWGWGT